MNLLINGRSIYFIGYSEDLGWSKIKNFFKKKVMVLSMNQISQKMSF